MTNTQRIIVEVDGESPFEYIIAKQGEANSRIVEVELMEKGVAYIIPDGVKAMVKYRKPDGKKVLNDCTYSSNIVTVIYTEQMLAAYGTGKGEIMLVKGTEIIKSATFWTKVVETVYKENGLISDDELVSLAGTLIEVNQTLDKIDSAVTGAETAVEEAEQALQQAEEMQQSCKVVTEKANQAAENCNEAIQNASAATTQAETATEKANQATESCNTATRNMQQECREAIDMVNIAISGADEATENANMATQDCNTAIQNAAVATEEANQAAEKCNDIIAGLTPRIGEDGNWYVGKEDTGVKANGGITVYDGFDSESTTNAASARTVKDLKEDLNNHTHNYAGSSSAGGAADSAVKLQTARSIKIGNETHSFDGTSNVAFTAETMNLAPKSHASQSTTYGIGTSNIYGHVKVSDEYTESAGNADEGVAASSEALANLYSETVKKTALNTVVKSIQITITPPCLIILSISNATWLELIVKSGNKAVLGTAYSSSVITTSISGNIFSITLNTTAYGAATYGVIHL